MFLHGKWKNFEDLEENISLPELEAMLKAIRDKEYREQKFAAALQGHDLDENTQEETSFDKVKRRVEAKLAGVSEETYELEQLGFHVIEE